jgi:hypothetical protein
MSMKNSDEDDATTQPSGQIPDDVCACCGTPIDTSDWYLVSKHRDSEGSLQLVSFCSEECQHDWHEQQEE